MTTNSPLYIGKRHYDENGNHLGGIKVVVDDSKVVEVEGLEMKICKEAYNSKDVLKFKNKTNKEVLDFIHGEFSCKFEQGKANSGDWILCRLVVLDNNKKDFNGTVKQILDKMQSEHSCRVSYGGNSMKQGGQIKGGKIISANAKKFQKVEISEEELAERWHKKKEHITQMAENVQSLRYNVTKDIKSEDEKVKLTALAIAVILNTAERVGNSDSEENGNLGVTGFQKKNIKIEGNTVYLEYVGKSSVEHEKQFSDELISLELRRAMKKSPCQFVFCTSDGFRIKADKINRYLQEFGVTAKDLRGFLANRYILDKLNKIDDAEILGDESKRKKEFNKIIKSVALKVGHGAPTLKKHYMTPELESEFVDNGVIISLKDFYKSGGEVKQAEVKENKEETVKLEEGGGVGGGVVYHGSPIIGEKGDLIPSNSGELGAGVYFTRNEGLAKNYSKPRGEVNNMVEAESKSGVANLDLSGIKIKTVTKDEYLNKRSDFYDKEQELNDGEWDFNVAKRAEEKLIKEYEKEGFDGIEVLDEQQGVIFPNSVKKAKHLNKKPSEQSLKLADGGGVVGDVERKPILFEDKNGNKIVFEKGDYRISVDNENNAQKAVLWHREEVNGKEHWAKRGMLNANILEARYSEEGDGDFAKYLKISEVEIEKDHRGQGLSTKLYKALIDYSGNGVKAILSYTPSRVNKTQVPKIWERLGGRTSKFSEDYQIIDIRFSKGGALASRKVVCSVIKAEDTNKYLLLQRSITSGDFAKWHFLCGSVDDGEDLVDAVKREVKEEVGYTLVEDPIEIETKKFDGYDFTYFGVVVQKQFIPNLNHENISYAWVGSIKEMLDFNLLPEVKKYLRSLNKSQLQVFKDGGNLDESDYSDSVDELADNFKKKLENKGYKITQGSDSKTDFGHSVYFYVNYENKSSENNGLGLKVRVSDHSVSNFNRMFDEIHISSNPISETIALKRIEQKFHQEYFEKKEALTTYRVKMETPFLQETDKVISERMSSGRHGKPRLIYEISREFKKPTILIVDKRTNLVVDQFDKKYSNGGEITPHVEVSTDLKLVLKELGYGDTEEYLYTQFKNISADKRDFKLGEDISAKEDVKYDMERKLKLEAEMKKVASDDSIPKEEQTKKTIKLIAQYESIDKSIVDESNEQTQKNMDLISDAIEGMEKYYSFDYSKEGDDSLTQSEIDNQKINKLITSIDARLDTRNSVKDGTDMFPQNASIDNLKVSEEVFPKETSIAKENQSIAPIVEELPKPILTFQEKYGFTVEQLCNAYNSLEKKVAYINTAYKIITNQDIKGYTWNAEQSDKEDYNNFLIDFLQGLADEGLKLKYPLDLDYGVTLNITPKVATPLKVSGIASLSKVVANDDFRPTMCSVFIDGDNYIATDANQLVVIKRNETESEMLEVFSSAIKKYCVKAKVDTEQTDEVVSKTINKLKREGLNGKIINLRDGRVESGKYPDYRAVIPTNHLQTKKIPIEELIAIANGANLAFKNIDSDAKAIQIKYNGLEEVVLYVNPQILLNNLQALQANGARSVVIGVSKPNRAITIHCDNGNLGLVMPIYFDAEKLNKSQEFEFKFGVTAENKAEQIKAYQSQIKTADKDSYYAEYLQKAKASKDEWDIKYYQEKVEKDKSERIADLQQKIERLKAMKFDEEVIKPIEPTNPSEPIESIEANEEPKAEQSISDKIRVAENAIKGYRIKAKYAKGNEVDRVNGIIKAYEVRLKMLSKKKNNDTADVTTTNIKTVRDLANLDAESQNGLLSGAFFSSLKIGDEFTVANKKYSVVNISKPTEKSYLSKDQKQVNYKESKLRIKDANGETINGVLWEFEKGSSRWWSNSSKKIDKWGQLSRNIEGDISVDLINENNKFHTFSDSYKKVQDAINLSIKDSDQSDVYADGGEIKDKIVCSNCGWSWNLKDTEPKDAYVCHKCGHDMSKKYCIAPNGKPSNLTPQQYVLVRTPQFKAWFGDWQNDKENSSKVIDENGEPLVVYHGGADTITEFDERYGGDTTANNEHGAFFFTNEKQVAEDYSKQAIIRRYEGRDEEELNVYEELSKKDIEDILENINRYAESKIKVICAFLNIRTLYIDDSYHGATVDTQKIQRQIGYVKKSIDEHYEFMDNDFVYDQEVVNSYKKEIEERARENNSLEEEDEIDEWQLSEAQEEILEENGVELQLNKYDGLLIKDCVDDIGDGSKIAQDEYVALKPNQIKLADGTNTTFNSDNADIRYEGGGEITQDETYKKWKTLVNMSKGELEKFYHSKEGEEAGLSDEEAKKLGIHSGRESARWIMKMKDTPHSEWTPTMWGWARRQISFISRMSGGRGELYDDKGNKTRKHTSLLIWGNDPTK